MKRLRPAAAAGLLALVDSAAADATLPYNPARLLVPTNSSSGYLFQASQGNNFAFGYLDLGSGLSRSNQNISTITSTLPFLDNDKAIAFTPVLDDSGGLSVVTGDCSKGAKGTEIWRWITKAERGQASMTGNWSRIEVQSKGIQGSASGMNFLASGVSFSETPHDDGTHTSLHVFGGMCPDSLSNPSNWIDSASYSNFMLNLGPSRTGTEVTSYDLTRAGADGPPIPEAGFTITSLPADSSSNSTGAAGPQEQTFVLIGGHTQAAFINMSQVALYSLPQNSWSFVPISPAPTAKADLATRDSPQSVEPRSGHTAVLSEDGNSIIVFGGWVGDVNTPATPQLAILNLNTGDSGDGNWNWIIPPQNGGGSGLDSNTGIYGHGATLLPGGVMMVVGGYTVPSPSSSRRKRQVQAANTKTYLFNTTSRAWVDTYKTPANIADPAESGNSSTQKVGLGAGLGVGGVVLISLVIIYFWYKRRLRRTRESRAQEVFQGMSNPNPSYPHGINQPFLQNNGSEKNSDRSLSPWNEGETPSPHYMPTRSEMEKIPDTGSHVGSTGLYVDLPSPTRGLRKPPAGKSYQYHSAPRFDERSAGGSRGGIHPIAEHENEDGTESKTAAMGHAMLTSAESKLMELRNLFAAKDPFVDPKPLASHPPGSPLPALPAGASTMRKVPPAMRSARRTPVAELEDTSNWYDEHGYEESSYSSYDGLGAGQISPTKTDDRTLSTLSDGSQWSGYSGTSIQRTMSMRTSNILQAAAARMTGGRSFETVNTPPQGPRTDTSSPARAPRSDSTSPLHYNSHTRTSTNDTSIGNLVSDSDSYATAKSSFIHLQNQGQALLGGGSVGTSEYGDRSHSVSPASHQGRHHIPSGASYLIPQPLQPSVSRRRTNGLMGSIRRALNVVAGDRGSSDNEHHNGFFDTLHDTPISSPTKEREFSLDTVPRRVASDGRLPDRLLSQKRGKKDWEGRRDDPDTGDWGNPMSVIRSQASTESEWDVESAANRRDIQVMFSVPKSQLRVVNDDMDRASLRSVSEGGISRAQSMRRIDEVESELYRPESYRREGVPSSRGSSPVSRLRAQASSESRLRDAYPTSRGSSPVAGLRNKISVATIVPTRPPSRPQSPPKMFAEESMVDSRVEDYYDDKLAVFGSSLGRPKGG